MSVYVDTLRPARNSRWPYSHARDLTADTEPELHAFGERIGLRREWHQPGRWKGSPAHHPVLSH